MKKLSVGTLLLALAAIFLGSCISLPGAAKDTRSQDTAQKVAGTWTLERFDSNKANVIGAAFDSGTLQLDISKRRATFVFELARSTIDAKLADWKKDYPDLNIDSYKIISIATWNVDKEGETIFFEAEDSDIEITGSGANFEGFFGWEMSKFAMTKSAKQSGGLLGGLMGAALAATTNTEDYFIKPDFAVGYWVQDFSSAGFVLNNKTGGYMVLKAR